MLGVDGPESSVDRSKSSGVAGDVQPSGAKKGPQAAKKMRISEQPILRRFSEDDTRPAYHALSSGSRPKGGYPVRLRVRRDSPRSFNVSEQMPLLACDFATV